MREDAAQINPESSKTRPTRSHVRRAAGLIGWAVLIFFICLGPACLLLKLGVGAMQARTPPDHKWLEDRSLEISIDHGIFVQWWSSRVSSLDPTMRWAEHERGDRVRWDGFWGVQSIPTTAREQVMFIGLEPDVLLIWSKAQFEWAGLIWHDADVEHADGSEITRWQTVELRVPVWVLLLVSGLATWWLVVLVKRRRRAKAAGFDVVVSEAA